MHPYRRSSYRRRDTRRSRTRSQTRSPAPPAPPRIEAWKYHANVGIIMHGASCQQCTNWLGHRMVSERDHTWHTARDEEEVDWTDTLTGKGFMSPSQVREHVARARAEWEDDAVELERGRTRQRSTSCLSDAPATKKQAATTPRSRTRTPPPPVPATGDSISTRLEDLEHIAEQLRRALASHGDHRLNTWSEHTAALSDLELNRRVALCFTRDIPSEPDDDIDEVDHTTELRRRRRAAFKAAVDKGKAKAAPPLEVRITDWGEQAGDSDWIARGDHSSTTADATLRSSTHPQLPAADRLERLEHDIQMISQDTRPSGGECEEDNREDSGTPSLSSRISNPIPLAERSDVSIPSRPHTALPPRKHVGMEWRTPLVEEVLQNYYHEFDAAGEQVLLLEKQPGKYCIVYERLIHLSMDFPPTPPVLGWNNPFTGRPWTTAELSLYPRRFPNWPSWGVDKISEAECIGMPVGTASLVGGKYDGRINSNRPRNDKDMHLIRDMDRSKHLLPLRIVETGGRWAPPQTIDEIETLRRVARTACNLMAWNHWSAIVSSTQKIPAHKQTDVHRAVLRRPPPRPLWAEWIRPKSHGSKSNEWYRQTKETHLNLYGPGPSRARPQEQGVREDDIKPSYVTWAVEIVDTLAITRLQSKRRTAAISLSATGDVSADTVVEQPVPSEITLDASYVFVPRTASDSVVPILPSPLVAAPQTSSREASRSPTPISLSSRAASPSSSVSSSSSSSDPPAGRQTFSTAFTNMSTITGKRLLAQAISNGPKNAPELSPRSIEPDVLHQFQIYCVHHFRAKSIPVEKQVSTIAPGFQDPAVANWYFTNEEDFQAMTMEPFLMEFRSRWLKRNWAENILFDISCSFMADSEDFASWVEKLKRKNALLRSEPGHLDEPKLYSHLTTHVCQKLRDFCMTDATKTAPLGARLSDAASSSRAALPKLTDAKRAYLTHFRGCFKCRRVNVSHLSKECPNDFPDAASYQPLCSSSWRAPSTTAPVAVGVARATRVNAVIEDDYALPSLPVGAFNYDALPPARCDSVFSAGDSSDEDFKYVNAPLTCPHLYWDAFVHSPSHLPCQTRMLIDSGAPAVLVDDALVGQLGLRCRPLPQTKSFSTAWGGAAQLATEWVKLRFPNKHQSWTSRTYIAIVVKDLFVPIILGLPFYTLHGCSIDPVCATIIRQADNLDIINCPPELPPPVLVTPRTAAAEAAEVRDLSDLYLCRVFRDVMRELVMDHPSVAAFIPVPEVTARSVFSAICHRIAALASIENLRQENDCMRTRFVDLFPDDIPPMDQLPSDVYHRFRLKDPNMSFPRRQYGCAKQHREAWRTLLNQHLAAGRMRPSSSPYASPAFLIAKKDPAALP
ncbi:hypothetical protein BDW22DRAFT_1433539 [Trametopsis cervina]|nr:hypothetical protein BDW22DRAFT_1433539 [Trametopsis cervina]